MATKHNRNDVRRRAVREKIWPDAKQVIFDVEDRATKGYFRAPRCVPMVASLINELSRENAGPLYVELWAQNRGQSLVEPESRETMYRAGYTTRGRLERTWRERIKILVENGFVRTSVKGLNEHGYVLLLDPHLAVLRLAQVGLPGNVDGSWMEIFKQLCDQSGVDLSLYEPLLAEAER